MAADDEQPGALSDTLPVPSEYAEDLGRSTTLESQRRLLDRYEIGEVIGRGATGYVYRGYDTVGEREVAIKFLRGDGDERGSRVGREATALRALPIPGVVQYVDDFAVGSDHVIVTELVDGVAFPGPARGEGGRCTWDSLRETVLALLETLSRVHAIGVVHRDLKPQNILVRPDGRPVILDFGLARGAAVGETFTRSGARLGTPRYWSPEQVMGQGTDQRTDLYSVGVMLFEALTGDVPPAQVSPDLHRVMASKPVSLADRLPDAPWRLVRTVDRMISLRADERFSSAGEVIGALQGADGPDSGVALLPRLGPADVLQALIGELRCGRAALVRGVSGTGRTRLVRDALAALGDGTKVTWLPPSNTPFASLAPVVGALENAPLALVSERVEAQVGEALRSGTILVADPLETLDSWSQTILERVASAGCLVRTATSDAEDGLRLHPLRPEHLEPLFHGPERLLHLPSDAAAALHRRTEGIVARVDQEVTAWVRAGICRWDGGKLRIDRAAIDSLAGGMTLAPVLSWAGESRPRLTAGQEDLLCWIHLAGAYATETLLAELTELPRWHVEALVEDLERMRVVRRQEGGAIDLLVPALRLAAWSGERLQQAHRVIAEKLPRESPDRVRHLLLAGDIDALERDTIAAALALVATGRLGLADSLFPPALAVARSRQRWDVEARLLAEQALVVLQMRSPAAVKRVAYEVDRARSGGALAPVRALLEAELESISGHRARARGLLEALGVIADPRLEVQRKVGLVQAYRTATIEEEAEALARIEAEIGEKVDHDLERRIAGWRGLLLYRRGDFAGAAESHLSAATLAQAPADRLSSQLNAASSLLECGEVARVQAIAAEARGLARQCRDVGYETRAEWLLRAAAYRAEGARAVDRELVEAVRVAGSLHMVGSVLLIEAAIAWRTGLGDAAWLAMEAARAFAEWGLRAGWCLARALAAAAGEALSDEELGVLCADIEEADPREVRLQAVALLSRAVGSDRLRDLIRIEISPLRPPSGVAESMRLDVLSTREVNEMLGLRLDGPA